MIHAKKVKPEYFEALLKGDKTFELRREDSEEPRFAVGDYLALNECSKSDGPDILPVPIYSGRCLLYRITYVLRDSPLLAPGVVALGLRPMPLCYEDLFGMHAARQAE